MIISRTPLRVSFVGGGSDLPSFCREEVGAVVTTAIRKYIYITDDTLSNPWNRLPTYWSAEVAAIETINREAARRVLTNLTIHATGTNSANLQSTGAAGRYVLETGFPNQWTPVATNLTPTGAINWPITNLTLPPNRLFRTRQD